MTQLNDISSALALLATRKSASVKAMGEPGPTAAQLDQILSCAVRVPDHGKLTPWRFILFEGEARAKFGTALRARWQELNPGHGENMLASVGDTLKRAPVTIIVVSKAAEHPKIPAWEQVLSAGAVCQTILLTATALGIGCQWNTGWIAYDEGVARILGLSAHEKVAGVIYLGTSTAPLEERTRPDPASLTSRWGEA